MTIIEKIKMSRDELDGSMPGYDDITLSVALEHIEHLRIYVTQQEMAQGLPLTFPELGNVRS